jgi:hypothetical protein
MSYKYEENLSYPLPYYGVTTRVTQVHFITTLK